MPIISKKKIPIIIWIPPIFAAIYKIEVITNSQTYDVTEIIWEAGYTDGVTDTIGNFKIVIDNSNEVYTTAVDVNDIVKFYFDYGTTAISKTFEGIIEKTSKKDNKLELTGRSVAAITLGTKVTYAGTGETSVILKALIDKYFSGVITYVNTQTGSTTVTVNWYQKDFWECVTELCSFSTFDAYIDYDYDMHYFPAGSITNPTEMIVHGYNLIETGDFTPDLTVMKNRIQVYGANINSLPIIATSEDSALITQYGLKEDKISDSNITTFEQAQARADFELANLKDPPIIGEITCLLLPTLQPGENVQVSDPFNGLQPGAYQVQKFEHKLSNDDAPQTIITIMKEKNTVSKVLKKRLKFEQQFSAQDNPNELNYSQIYDFIDASGTFVNTQVTQGFLTTTGGATGTWTSDLIVTPINTTICEVRVSGNQLTGTGYQVSVDNGINWQVITPNVKLTLAPPGQNLLLKITLNSATTQIDTSCFMYK